MIKPEPGEIIASGYLQRVKLMQMSKYNLLSKIEDSDSYYIINVLSGEADLLEPSIARAVLGGEIPDKDAFIKKGYLVDPVEESRLYKEKYFDFIKNRENDEIQIFFVPWYNCNFKCSYCYQDSYVNNQAVLDTNVINAFYSYIEKKFTDKKKYITLFGGEPLLEGQRARDFVENFLNEAWIRDIETSVVTNGYNLCSYTDLFAGKPMREIQVTLDGTEKIHNGRRMLRGSQSGTFEAIVNGIDSALKNDLKINLRVVVDRGNIEDLPELASFAINRGWTGSSKFKTQIGRNYELHHCSADPKSLFSRIELYHELYKIIEEYPHFLHFHKPAFSLSRFLSENGSLPGPLFDACPGCKTEWAFDYTGSIYSCTATVGKTDQKLGAFYPEVNLDEQAVNMWKSRNVTTINECKNCSQSLICGGGCAAVATKGLSNILAPDCRHVIEAIGLGVSHYFRKELANE